MKDKRRDSKNRILREGEVQLADGRYRFKYLDYHGAPRYVYSWRLSKTDHMPNGKRQELSLREKEEQIKKNSLDQIVGNCSKYTVLDLAERYVATKAGVRHSTQAGYQVVINFLKTDPMGSLPIDKVKTSDAKYWFVKLQQDGKKRYSSLHTVRGVLRQAFRMAVDDDILRKNPFDFPLSAVIVNDSVTREALSKAQEDMFLRFVKGDPHYSRYYDGIYILFHTGLRISEFTGLTRNSIDFKEHRIIVDHQLQRTSKMKYVIEPTKTESGKRMIPMTPDVEACFRRILEKRSSAKIEPVIDRHSGFLYLDHNGMPLVALHWEKYFQRIVEKHNRTCGKQLPKITPHVCRHTFCSRMAMSGMNPKTLQYIMGHSDVSVTMNTYTHVKYEDALSEIKRIHAV